MPAAEDVSLDAPAWFHVPKSRVARRPPSPNSLLVKNGPKAVATVANSNIALTTDLIADPDRSAPPPRGKLGVGKPGYIATKEGRKTLMIADKASKPSVRNRDPRALESRHRAAMAKTNGAAFRRSRGTMSSYIESAVKNRHILPIQQSHQRLSPLETALPKEFSKSKSANIFDFHRLHDAGAAASRARTAAGGLRGRGVGGGLGAAVVREGARTAPSNIRKMYLQKQMDRMALQSRSITRLSPRDDKDIAAGYGQTDAFSESAVRNRAFGQTRLNTSVTRPRTMGARTPGGDMWASQQLRASTAAPAVGAAGSGAGGGSGADAGAGAGMVGGESTLGSTWGRSGAVSAGLGAPDEFGMPPMDGGNYGGGGGLSHSYTSPAVLGASAGSGTGSAVDAGFVPPQSKRERARESADTLDEINAFEKTHSLHGPRGMTKKELRLKLRDAEGLGVDLNEATKEELVVAYMAYQQVRRASKGKAGAPPGAGVVPGQGVARPGKDRAGKPGGRGAKVRMPKFNTVEAGGGGGPQKLTPRSAASLASFFNESQTL